MFVHAWCIYIYIAKKNPSNDALHMTIIDGPGFVASHGDLEGAALGLYCKGSWLQGVRI